MGTKFFHSAPSGIKVGNQTGSSRAFGGSSYMARSAGGGAQKDVAAASAMSKVTSTKGFYKGSAYAPSPKKV